MCVCIFLLSLEGQRDPCPTNDLVETWSEAIETAIATWSRVATNTLIAVSFWSQLTHQRGRNLGAMWASWSGPRLG